jgi:UDP-glucose 4-epimerase
MKILVTGGAGFIGSHIVEHFQGRATVRVLDNLRSGFKHNLAGFNCELIEASILDRDAVRQAVQDVDYVFHLAAMISVPESMANRLNVTKLIPRARSSCWKKRPGPG